MPRSQNLSINSKIKEAGRHTVIYGLGSVAQSASGLILLPILTGALSSDDFGAYSLILMASGIASAIFYFGMTSALPRSYFDCKTDEDRKSVTTTAFGILLIGALLQTIIGYTYRESIAKYLLGNEKYAEALFHGLLSAATVFINTFLFGYLRLVKKSVASVVFSLVALVATVGLTLYFQSQMPGDAAAPFVAVSAANSIVAFLFFVNYGRAAFNLKIKKTEISNLMSFGIASIVTSFGGLLIDSIDRILIHNFMGLTEVGHYSAALRVGMLINVLLIMPFNQIWSPMMLEYRHKENINKLFTKVFTVYMMLGILVIAIATIFSWEILSILIKTEISNEMMYVFVGTLIGMLLMSATNFFSAGLFYERKVNLLPIAYYAVVGVKFVAGLVLIPVLGLTGALVAGLISSTLLPVAVWKLSKKFFSFDVEWHRLVRVSLLVAPTLIWVLYSSVHKTQEIHLKITWMIIQILIIYSFGLENSERWMPRKSRKEDCEIK